MFVHKNTQKSTFLSAYAVACTVNSPPLGWSLISMNSVSPTLCPYWGVGPNIDSCTIISALMHKLLIYFVQRARIVYKTWDVADLHLPSEWPHPHCDLPARDSRVGRTVRTELCYVHQRKEQRETATGDREERRTCGWWKKERRKGER